MTNAARHPMGALCEEERRCMSGIPSVPSDDVKNRIVRYFRDEKYSCHTAFINRSVSFSSTEISGSTFLYMKKI